MIQRDKEIDSLRKEKNVSLAELADVLDISYSCLVQRICGYARFQSGEREKIIQYINERTG